jgi:hypothetical protein
MMKKEKIYQVVLLLMPLVVFLPQYISGNVIGWLDLTYYFLPFRIMTADCIQHGIMPFWNPFIYCGNPLMANMQSAVFYPLNIFYHVLPPVFAVKITTYLIFAVMALFTFAFIRLYKVSENGSFLGAFIFAFGFYSVVKAVEFAEINVMGWMPAALYFTKRYSITRKISDLLMIPFMLCLSFLGGHAQFFIYVWLVFTFFFIFENIYMKKDERKKGIIDLLLVNIFLLAISLIQLLPTAEFVLLSKRVVGGLGYGEIMGGFLGFEHVLALIFPFITGLFSKYSNYLNWVGLINIGTLPMLLLLLGSFKIKDFKLRFFLLSISLFFLFVSFIGYMPFYSNLFKTFPVFSAVKYQSKSILGLFFVMCLMIGHGFDALFERPSYELKKFRIFSLWFFIIILAFYLFADIFKVNILAVYKSIFDPKMSVQEIYDLFINYDAFIFKFMVYVLFLAGTVAVIYMASTEKNRGSVMKVGAVLLSVVSLFVFQKWDYMHYIKGSLLLKPTKQIEFLKTRLSADGARLLAPIVTNQLDDKRVFNSNVDMAYFSTDSLTPNIPMNFKFKNLDGFDSLFIGNFSRFKSCFNETDKPWDMPAFSLFSAKYIISKALITGRSIRLVSRGASDIYENSNFLAPVFFAGNTPEFVALKGDNELNLIKSASFDPLRTVILQDENDKKIANEAIADDKKLKIRSQVTFSMIDINTYKITNSSPSSGMLILTDNYYPGWNAYIDGVRAKIMKVDVTFKGVLLAAGTHTVIFRFVPVGFMTGVVISMLFIILLMPVLPALLKLL